MDGAEPGEMLPFPEQQRAEQNDVAVDAQEQQSVTEQQSLGSSWGILSDDNDAGIESVTSPSLQPRLFYVPAV